MRRGEAERLIDHVRVMLACGKTALQIETRLRIQYGLEPLAPCDGEAHGNPHIDHCSRCGPRWGFTGKAVKIT